MTVKSKQTRQISQVSKFEIQSHVFQQLVAMGYSVRGGITVPIGKGFHHVDIAVMKERTVDHVILISTATESISLSVREKRNRHLFRRADRIVSRGVAITLIDSLKSASDMIAYVRKNQTFPSTPIPCKSPVSRSAKQIERTSCRKKLKTSQSNEKEST